jgi:Mg/Co/Ni transporter MgtE
MDDDNSIFLPENVRKNWKQFTDDELALAMSIPSASNELIKFVTQMDDRQLRIIVPFMDDNQIKKVIPSLELEKQGVAVQVMNSHQIRRFISVIPQSDRQILLSNISLLLEESRTIVSDKNDELQSFISFIDPLALGTLTFIN